MAKSRRLQQKDMMVLREQDSAWEQHRSTRANLKDYSLKHKVSLYWDFSDESRRDQMLIMEVDDYKVVLDAEEIQRITRWV